VGDEATPRMRVLVTGANGFIGAQIVAALAREGHAVVCAVRAPGADPRLRAYDAVPCDFARDVDPAAWRARLDRIDAVVNCAGILRERGAGTFGRVHHDAPLALARACVEAGIRRFVQVSALGDPRDAPFLESKHRFDAALAALDLDFVVLRPSLVYATHGSYGGTSTLRAMAALPGFVPAPSGMIQPLAAEDLAGTVLAALAAPARQTLELGGPEVLTLAQYLAAWRAWLGLPPARELRIPRFAARLGARIGQWAGAGPTGTTMQRMLERGNVTQDSRAHGLLGFAPRSLAHALAAAPSQVQDRWHAKLHFLAPALRVALALVWIGSGIAGLLAPVEYLADVFGAHGAALDSLALLAFAGSVVDLALGVLLLLRVRVRAVLALMLAITVVYTVFLAVAGPQLWLEPLGGLLKNLVLIPATMVAAATAESR
jgi:uncharacterized protein YbjT (DUF2867 family)